MFLSRNQRARRSHSIKIDNSNFERLEEFRYLGKTLTNQNSIQGEINYWSRKEREISSMYFFTTTVYCFSISYIRGDCSCNISRVIRISTSRELHISSFSYPYFTWIFCDFITTLLKYSFPVETHSAWDCTVALHGVRRLCSRTSFLYWQTTVVDGRECIWPVHLGPSPITLPTTVLWKYINPNKTCISRYPA